MGQLPGYRYIVFKFLSYRLPAARKYKCPNMQVVVNDA